tara:strand:- start:12290 stop:12922 length:633 start_codon:yes stop_codon:yes gene_type:complete
MKDKILAFKKIKAVKQRYANITNVYCSSSGTPSSCPIETQNDIYNDVTNFSSGKIYKKNHAVKQGGYFKYALIDKECDLAFVAANWGGIATDNIDGVTRPSFIWKPSYQDSTNFEPKVVKISFGEGYEQRVSNGINNNLLKFDYSFEDRNQRETFSILHFLNERNSKEMFLFIPHFPYVTQKRFICRSWSESRTFYDNFTIRAQFEEVAA